MNMFDPSANTTSASHHAAALESSGVTESPSGHVIPALLKNQRIRSAGKVRPMVLLWALGVPLPIVLIILLVRGCS